MQRRPIKEFTLCGGYGLGVPPVPIPNTEVKPQHADGTWLETARESRSLPHPSSPLAQLQAGLFVLKTPRQRPPPYVLNELAGGREKACPTQRLCKPETTSQMIHVGSSIASIKVLRFDV